MLWRNSRGRPLNAPAAFIHPCQPIVAKEPPMGAGWAHELKHDGYRPLLILLALMSLNAWSYSSHYSTSQDVKFSKRGITQQQLDEDWSACRKDNTVAMSFAEAYTEPKRPTSYAEEYLINGCMAAKGYTVTW